MQFLVVVTFAVFLCFVGCFGIAKFNRLSRWNRIYTLLGKKFGGDSKKNARGGVVPGTWLRGPSLSFDYGRTFCTLRNVKSRWFSTRRATELTMLWPERSLKLDVATQPLEKSQVGWRLRGLRRVEVEDPSFQSHFNASANDVPAARRLLSVSVRWQLERLRSFLGDQQLRVTIRRSQLVVGKPGYIREAQPLEDFVRLSLELFDQMMLVDPEGLSFVNDDSATIIGDVKCPICSEEILNEMVICTRCKTPHCQDCWEYNGQCATFACQETRFVALGGESARET